MQGSFSSYSEELWWGFPGRFTEEFQGKFIVEDLQPKKKKDRAFCGSGKKKSEKKKRGRRSGKRNDWRQKRKKTGKAEKKRLVL